MTTCVQCAHRFASRGMSLKHSGHFLVVGAAAGSSLCIRAINQFTGTTTKKYTAAAISKKEMTALIKSPTRNTLPRMSYLRLEKSGSFTSAPMNGVNKPFVSEPTTPPNAAPITTPTAISTTFPRRMNFLNPSNIAVPSQIEVLANVRQAGHQVKRPEKPGRVSLVGVLESWCARKLVCSNFKLSLWPGVNHDPF